MIPYGGYSLCKTMLLAVIYKKRKYDNVTPLLYELHWLPIKQRIDFKICVMCYKAINNMAPGYLCDTIDRYVPARTLRSSSDTTMLVIPDYNYVRYGKRSFAYYGPSVWNTLPKQLRESSSLSLFKQQLKHHLFLQAYSLWSPPPLKFPLLPHGRCGLDCF